MNDLPDSTTPQLKSLRGVIPPLVTPLTADREVDTASLRKVVRHLLSAGVDGLFVLGSSGEGAFLTDTQRQEVVETAVSEAAGQVPVVAGVIDVATRRVIEHAHSAVKSGAYAIVATAPFYGSVHPNEIAEHFTRISESVDAPLIAYDIPSLVGTKLSPNSLAELAHAGVLAAVKDSSGNEGSFRRLIMEARGLPNFSLFTGSEIAADSALMMGADGVVPGLGNIDPAGYVRLYRYALEGQWEAARAEQDRLITLFELVDIADAGRVGRLSRGVGAFKEALALLDIIENPVLCAPFGSFNTEERRRLAEFLRTAGFPPSD